MENEYEYVIVGGGPSGLTCAQMLTKLNKKVLIIEREETLGGSHRVKRVNERFTQHSPMVYTTAAKNFITLLQQIGYSFEKHFVPYNFSIFTVFNDQLRKQLSIGELGSFTKDFLIFVFDNDHLNDVSVLDYCQSNNFSEKTLEILDKICRLSDGGDASRYSVNSLFELLNQNIFYGLYQPKQMTDIGLFKVWGEYLTRRNVDVVFDEDVVEIDYENKMLNRKYTYDKLILCIPPEHITKLTGESLPKDISYNVYVSVTFHYGSYFEIEKHHGFSITPWGIFWVVTTDYTEDDKPRGVIISVTASVLDVKSDKTTKTLNETMNVEEVQEEIFRQLNLNFNRKLPRYTEAILNPNNYYDEESKTWECKDSAFLDIPNPVYMDLRTNFKDVYYIGAFNGMTHYKPTSIEKAVTNSMNGMIELEPELEKYYKVVKGFYLDKFIKIIILLIIITIVILILR